MLVGLLPTQIKRYTVNCSVHTDKKSREHLRCGYVAHRHCGTDRKTVEEMILDRRRDVNRCGQCHERNDRQRNPPKRRRFSCWR